MFYKKSSLSLFALIPFLLFSQSADLPKVAVLDATLGEGVHNNASAIVSDTINEQFVKSPLYRVTDRAYISSVQEEKKFQLSGEVSEEDIKEIGQTFGADFICAPHVSLLGSTYTISARLIEVSTAEVFSQESDRKKGNIDILYNIAEVVGAKLVGTDISEAAPVNDDPVVQVQPNDGPTQSHDPAPAAEPTPTYTPRTKTRAPAKTKGHLMFSYMFPVYGGAESFSDSGYAPYDIADNYVYTYDDAYGDNLGLDIHYLGPFMENLYISLGFTFSMQTLYIEDGSYTYEFSNFITMEPYVGFGAIYAPLSFIDFYGGVTLGYMIFLLGEEYAQDATDTFWVESGEAAYGVSFGLEIGTNIYMGSLGLDLRYRWSYANSLEGEIIFPEDYSGDSSFSHGGFLVGLGFMY